MNTLLVVDDAPENLLMLSSILSPHYRVLAANSGQKALQIAKGSPRPDLILLDVMMPVMDGYQVLQALQNDQDTRNVPVIFVTAMNGVTDEIKGLELGASDLYHQAVASLAGISQSAYATGLEARQ